MIISPIAILASHLRDAWRWIYVAAMDAGVCFPVLVGVAQSFAKVPAIRALAPTMAEPSSAIAQLTVPAICVAIGLAPRAAADPSLAA